MRLSPAYSGYAAVYDRIGQRAFGERMAANILDWLASRRIRPKTVLDLGCGTGAATIAFAREGLEATGLDRSTEMLARARENATLFPVSIDFIEGDLLEPPFGRTFDLVTAIYDTVNYLEDEWAVARFAANAFELLNPGGVLVFDMNTRHRLMSSWEQGLMLAADTDDLFVTYRSWFDETLDASPLIVTGFERENGNRWIRFDEEHVERSWAISTVERLLEDAGLLVGDLSGYNDADGAFIRPASEDQGRAVFFASRETRSRRPVVGK